MRTRLKRSAFTLIELLVVVGIIAMMISILIPALNMARSAAMASQCLANLHQFQIAGQMFQAENRGGMSFSIPELFPKYSFNQELDGADTKDTRFKSCPAVVIRQASAEGDRRFEAILSLYGWNNWAYGVLSTEVGALKSSKVHPFIPAHIRNASEVVELADIMDTSDRGLELGSNNNLTDPFGTVIPALSTPTAASSMRPGRPNFHGRHAGKGGVLWFDGHASLEIPTDCPMTMPVNSSDINNSLAQPWSFYKANHIGYLAPGGMDITKPMAAQYFFSNKSGLAQTTSMNQCLKKYWIPNPDGTGSYKYYVNIPIWE